MHCCLSGRLCPCTRRQPALFASSAPACLLAGLLPTHPHHARLPCLPGPACSRRGGKLRTSEYAVADRGPRQEVPPEWVPQLQLHMLCTGGQGWEQSEVGGRSVLPAGAAACLPSGGGT